MGVYVEPTIQLKDVIAQTGLSRSSIYRRMAAKEFPINLEAFGRVYWLQSDIDNSRRINIVEPLLEKKAALAGNS